MWPESLITPYTCPRRWGGLRTGRWERFGYGPVKPSTRLARSMPRQADGLTDHSLQRSDLAFLHRMLPTSGRIWEAAGLRHDSPRTRSRLI